MKTKTLGFGVWAILALLIPAVASAQTISVTSCPATVAPGGTVTVTWSISGGTGSLTHNHVHYGYPLSAVNQYYTAHTYTTPYCASFTAPASGTFYLKVDAIKGGKAFQSVIYTVRVVAPPTVSTPTFSPVPQTFSSTIKVSIVCATTGATIRYTTNGTDPTSSSTVYSGPLTFSASTTLKARAFKSGMTDSAVATGVYTKSDAYEVDDTPAQAKTITSGQTQNRSIHASGNVDWVKFTLMQTSAVAIDTNGASGDNEMWLYGPNSSTSLAPAPNYSDDAHGLWAKIVHPSLPPGTYYFKIQEYNNDGTIPSYTLSLTVTPVVQQVAKPTFNPTAPRTFASTITVSIACATTGATIRYTTNGTDPTSSSAIYTSPLTFSASTILKARAFKSGMTDSAVASGTYTKLGSVATPTFSPAPPQTFTSTITVSIACATTGATIRYTTNGTDPTSSSTVYSGPLTFSATTTLKARAFKSGLTDSAVSSGTYANPVKYVTLTRSNHPSLTSPNSAQNLFNTGAQLLLSDDDGTGTGDTNDDVSLDVRFTINTATRATFPDQSATSFPAAERYNYALAIYNDIPNDTAGMQLLNATFAQVKQVNSGYDFTGWSNSANRTLILTQVANRQTAIHEWGHNCGLPHRSDPAAIMYDTWSSTKNEINTTERTAMSNY